MHLKLALPILAASALVAGSALAQTADPAAPAAPADGPIATVSAQTPPPPAPGQTPTLLAAPPGVGPFGDGWLPYQQDDKKMHGQVSAGFDSRGGQYYSGSVEGPIGDNAWMGISVSQSKWRW